MRARTKQPRGTARSDYRMPCPGCGSAPRQGQTVTRIDTGDGTRRWWHQECRNAYLSTLRQEWADP